MSIKKFLLIESDANVEYGYYGEAFAYEPVISVTEITTISEFLKHLKKDRHGWFISDVKELLKCPNFCSTLNQLGWQNTNKIKDIEEKLKTKKEFFIYEGNFRKSIDLEDLSYRDLQKLAKDKSILVQTIDTSCLKAINSNAHKKLQNYKKKEAERKKKAKERAEAKKLAVKEKKIQEAKSLLEKENLL